jgi:flagellar protein FliO/FliZ
MQINKLMTATAAALMPAIGAAQSALTSGESVGASLTASSLRMLASLTAVLVLLGGCAWLLRRWRDRQHGPAGAIEIVSGVSLGAKERVVLLRVGDEQVLVGVSPAGMRCLHVVQGKALPPKFDLALGSNQ